MAGNYWDPDKNSVSWGILIAFIYAFLGFLIDIFNVLKHRF